MDRFIGPTLPSGHILPPVKGNPQKKKQAPFQLPQNNEDEPSSSTPAPDTSESTSPAYDLPIGPARFDEAGQRIDTTA